MDKAMTEKEWLLILKAVFENDSRFNDFVASFDFVPSCEYAFNVALSEREQSYLRIRYAECRSMRAIAYKDDLSVERVRQILMAALDKLRSPDVAPILLYGVRGYANHRASDAAQIAAQTTAEKCLKEYTISFKSPAEYANNANLYRLPLSELGLSNRSKHALFSVGCSDVGDVLTLGRDRLVRLRNIGEKSYNEICDAIEKLGIDVHYIRPKETTYEQVSEKENGAGTSYLGCAT